MKNVLKKIVAFWGVLIAPVKVYLAKRKTKQKKKELEQKRLKSIEDLKASFSKTFNVNIDESVKVMKSQKSKQTDKDFLTEQLVKARKYMNENGIQPGGGQVTNIDDMVDHNTNGGYTNKSIGEVIRQDNELAKKFMNGNLDNERKLKAKLRWVQRG